MKGGNPCLEQSLESYELCCLVETFPARHATKEEYLRTLKFAYLYAKTVTLRMTHWPETNRVMLRNRRIGCSVSGVADFLGQHSLEELRQWLDEGYQTVQHWDEVYSNWFCIPRSIKTTSVKPSGTVSLLAGALRNAGVAEWVQDLVVGGVLTGVGSVLKFLPTIVILFLLLSILEDSGYMARAAFLMDKPLRKLGLNGRSFIPMMMGFGCTVPAVMSARSMNNDRDRRFTIMLTPFMSCGAKVPIYALFTRAFFPGNQVWVMTGMYLLGILVAIGAGLVLKRTVFHGDAAPFIMELPAYRLPTPANVLRQMWDKAKDFLQRAFTVIFLATLIVWFLQNFTFRLEMTSEIGESMLGKLAGLIAPVFAPAGFGSVEASTAVITGLMAKESVVSTLAVLSGVDAESAQMVSVMRQIFPSTLAAVSFLVFVLLYMPCVAAVAAMRREMESSRWAYGTIAAQTALAWTLATLVFQLGRLLGMG